ncbi:MAG: glutamine synthetase, partial [Pseudomonadota bacterium]
MYELKTKTDVLKVVREKNVSFIQLWFTDVLGVQKIFSITPNELEEG